MLKDITKVFGANLVKMLVALVTTFLVPKILTIDGFGHYKMFTFYLTYVGLTQLGFCDGIYLKYGGLTKQEINAEHVTKEHSTFLMYEIVSSLIVIVVGLLIKSFEITMLGITILPLQMYSFYSFLYQATGQLSEYSKRLTVANLGKLIVYLALVIFNVKDYKFYIYAVILLDYLLMFLYLVPFVKETKKLFDGFSVKMFYDTCKIGLLLMFGNLMYELFLGVDKWFIKFTLPLSDFSYYAFAGQLITAVNMVVTPISMTLYSYISRNKSEEFEVGLKNKLIVFLMLIPLGGYVVEVIIYLFLDKYIPAIPVIEILMVSQIFWALNTTLLVNMFKAYRKQNVYFIKMSVSLIIALVLDIIAYYIYPSIISYSIVTMAISFVWLLINTLTFKHMCLSVSDLLFIFLLICLVFLIKDFSVMIRICAYLIVYLLLVITLKRNTMLEAISFIKSFAKKNNGSEV